MLNLLGNVVRGFIMGAADVVPGVSGGTVALVLGIYQRLISSVRDGAKVLGRLVNSTSAAHVVRFSLLSGD